MPPKPSREPIDIGGLMRCCLQTLGEQRTDDKLPAEEGDRLRCSYCDATMRFSRGIWRGASELGEDAGRRLEDPWSGYALPRSAARLPQGGRVTQGQTSQGQGQGQGQTSQGQQGRGETVGHYLHIEGSDGPDIYLSNSDVMLLGNFIKENDSWFTNQGAVGEPLMKKLNPLIRLATGQQQFAGAAARSQSQQGGPQRS